VITDAGTSAISAILIKVPIMASDKAKAAALIYVFDNDILTALREVQG